MAAPKQYPLSWPDGWPRSKTRTSSQFKTTLPGAIKNVEKSIELFSKDSGHKVEGMLISSNVTLMDSRPKDSGVAIYFTWDGIATCIAVDRYEKLEENLQAIHHVIEAERTKLRHGGLNIVRAGFRGYAALPPPRGTGMEIGVARRLLGVSEKDAEEEIQKAYHAKAMKAHPDHGGSAEQMAEFTMARDTILGAKNGR